jgi:hypothetical protein
MVWGGARDHDDDRAPGVLSDALCLLFALLNAAAWPILVWLIFSP